MVLQLANTTAHPEARTLGKFVKRRRSWAMVPELRRITVTIPKDMNVCPLIIVVNTNRLARVRTRDGGVFSKRNSFRRTQPTVC